MNERSTGIQWKENWTQVSVSALPCVGKIRLSELPTIHLKNALNSSFPARLWLG